MPRFDVDRKRSLSLPSTLVDVAGCIVENAEHGHDSIGRTVGAFDVRTSGADIVYGQTNASSILGNLSTLLERVIDTTDAVFLCRQQEATGHLRLRGS